MKLFRNLKEWGNFLAFSKAFKGKIIICVFIALAVMPIIITGCKPKSVAAIPVYSRTLHLGHLAPVGTAYDILAHKISEYVETRSNGRYRVQIYPGGSLGNHQMLIESMIAGTVDLSIVTASDMSNFARDLEVQDLPFLFSDWDEVFKFLKSDFINEFYQLTDSSGIYTLAFMPRGFRHATNNKGPINKPSDFQGMKLRVLGNAIYIDTFTALGAALTPMPWEQVYAALQEGRVEGQENTIATIKDYKIYEVQKYLSKTGHLFAFAAVGASPVMFNAIPIDDRALIRKAVIDAALDVGAEQLADEKEMEAALRSHGMLVNEIADKQPFVDRMNSVYDQFFLTHDRKYFDGIKNAVRN